VNADDLYSRSGKPEPDVNHAAPASAVSLGFWTLLAVVKTMLRVAWEIFDFWLVVGSAAAIIGIVALMV
jgi:hypothetical protein